MTRMLQKLTSLSGKAEGRCGSSRSSTGQSGAWARAGSCAWRSARAASAGRRRSSTAPGSSAAWRCWAARSRRAPPRACWPALLRYPDHSGRQCSRRSRALPGSSPALCIRSGPLRVGQHWPFLLVPALYTLRALRTLTAPQAPSAMPRVSRQAQRRQGRSLQARHGRVWPGAPPTPGEGGRGGLNLSYPGRAGDADRAALAALCGHALLR
jgi:hypothetical protein